MTQDEYNAIREKGSAFEDYQRRAADYRRFAEFADTWGSRNLTIGFDGPDRITLDRINAAALGSLAKAYFLRKAAECEKAMEEL